MGTRARGKMAVEGCRSIKITKKWNAGGGAKLPFEGCRIIKISELHGR